jgi:hypothetical protein
VCALLEKKGKTDSALNLKSSRNNKMFDLSDVEINTTVKMLKYPKQVEAIPFDLPET